jgi:signal transduction histidine kinase
VKTPRLLRTTSFRLTALYAVYFAASMVLIFAIVFWVATDVLNGQIRLSLQSELASLPDVDATEPTRAIISEIEQRVDSGSSELFYYGIQDGAGRVLAGNVPVLVPFEGWQEIPHRDDVANNSPNRETKHHLLALGHRFPDGSLLTVATDTYRMRESEEAIARSFAWAAGATLLLGLVGGITLSHGFLRRVDEINRTTRAIMRGDLTDRIRTRGTGDELDELGQNLNDMLDRLRDLMEGLKQVSNDIAHDLRTPLSRLKQRLEAASEEAQSVEDYEEAIRLALKETDTALATFGALLRIAQIETGTRRANFTDIDLSAIVADLAMTYDVVAEDLGRTLVSSVDSGLHIHGDRELLTQLFVNLIENALRHAPQGAQVRLSAKAERRGPVVEIADNGPGIPAAERINVFKRFYRLENARSTPGSGLGLALVAAVVELHDAHIELADNAPGLRVALQFNESTRA